MIRHLRPGSPRDLEIAARRAGATTGDLATALDPGGPGDGLWIDGRRVPASTPLDRAGIVNGSTVSTGPVPVTPRGGPGEVSPDGPGERRPASDLVGTGTTPRNRTGHPPSPSGAMPVRLPEPEPAAPSVTPIGLVAMAVSVLGAAVMVAVLGSWTYAAFAVVGPLMMVANTVDSRYRRRRVRRRYERLLRREILRLRSELEVAGEAERGRLAVAHPGAATAALVAGAEPPRCWERRPDHPDAYRVRVGFGVGRWSPTVEGDLAAAAGEVRSLVEQGCTIPAVPLGIRVQPGRPVAVVGPGDRARALARSIVAQLVALHGPVDLQLASVVAGATAAEWDWLAWLPHTVDGSGRSRLTTSGPDAEEMSLGLSAPPAGMALVVVDDPTALRARRSAARTLLRAATEVERGIACLLVLDPDDPVPASCSVVLRVGHDGDLAGDPTVVAGPADADLMAREDAATLARRLSRFDDPELDSDGRDLPQAVRLASLLDLDGSDPRAVVDRWHGAGPDPSPAAKLGLAADGPLVVDLVADGPHALVVGTTGSGKSEALRSLVLSLAVDQSPDHLVFVLVDFKGGSAFDACADLPHTVGLVTDLDDHLAARALRCLEAELRHRERRFRSCGADDLSAFRRLDRTGEPLPRLVVVVDELAALAAAVPSFIDALVDVAQRGRSLGVHLVLATQRPGGALTPAIRANVGLKVALRVQGVDDSRDLIDSPAAADLPRHVPGRAVVRFGPGDLVPVQLACATLPVEASLPPVTIRPLQIPRGADPAPHPEPSTTDPAAVTDLDQLVDGLAAAWRSTGRPPPRRPWPDPLPNEVSWPLDGRAGEGATRVAPTDPLDAAPTGLALGLLDDPDHQRVVPFRWELRAGPLLGVGLPGSGPQCLASTAALAAADRWRPDQCHIHVLDATGTDLVPLSGLPHVGAVVTSAEVERQHRLVQSLAAELAARRSGGPAWPLRLLVVHGVTALQGRWEESGHVETWSLLLDLVAEGARFGVHVCCTAEGASVPHRLLASCSQRVVFRLGDPADRAAFGLPTRPAPDLPPGRALTTTTDGPSLVQVARPPDGLASAVARVSGTATAARLDPGAAPSWVGVLPDLVRPTDLEGCPGGPTRPLLWPDGGIALPIGLADRGLVTATLSLPPGAHAIVSGPPGSGRSTALEAIALAAAALPGLRLVVVSRGRGRSWPDSACVVDPDDRDLDHLAEADGPLLVLVDDADRTADEHSALSALAFERRPDRHVVAAGRNDRFRSRYGHWSRELRADGVGVLLMPDPDLDGDLVGARLPRRPPVAMLPGRAWLTGRGAGAGGFIHLVKPDAARPS